jgi:hypothetical protein
MALPTSGEIKFSNIATVFGGTGQHAISEYYKGGSNVASALAFTNYSAGLSGAYPANIPASGEVQLADFYGASVPQQYTAVYPGTGTSPIITAWGRDILFTFTISDYLGPMTAGDEFAVTVRSTDSWPNGWNFPATSRITNNLTYGTNAGTITASIINGKQFVLRITYTGGTTVTGGGIYVGGASSFKLGQSALHSITRR